MTEETEAGDKNPYLQAARDAKYFASLFKRMALVEKFLRQAGDLETLIRNQQARLDALTAEGNGIQLRIDECNAYCVETKAQAGEKAASLIAEAENMRAQVTAILNKQAGVLKEIDERIAAKNAQFEEVDQKYRRTREKLADIKKSAEAGLG